MFSKTFALNLDEVEFWGPIIDRLLHPVHTSPGADVHIWFNFMGGANINENVSLINALKILPGKSDCVCDRQGKKVKKELARIAAKTLIFDDICLRTSDILQSTSSTPQT